MTKFSSLFLSSLFLSSLFLIGKLQNLSLRPFQNRCCFLFSKKAFLLFFLLHLIFFMPKGFPLTQQNKDFSATALTALQNPFDTRKNHEKTLHSLLRGYAPTSHILVKNEIFQKGKKECEFRYLTLKKKLLSLHEKEMTILLLSDKEGYYSIRLASDFPNSVIVALAPSNPFFKKLLLSLFSLNPQIHNLILLQKPDCYQELQKLAEKESFTAIISLESEKKGEEQTLFLESLASLGKHLFIESSLIKTSKLHEALIKKRASPLRYFLVQNYEYTTLFYLESPHFFSNTTISKKTLGTPFESHQGIFYETFLEYQGIFPPINSWRKSIKKRVLPTSLIKGQRIDNLSIHRVK